MTTAIRRPRRRAVDNTDWRHRAECRDAPDAELWFPVGSTGPALLQIEEAKAVCRRCPVMEICRQWALETGQDAGVWGGLSEDERRTMLRRQARRDQAAAEKLAERHGKDIIRAVYAEQASMDQLAERYAVPLAVVVGAFRKLTKKRTDGNCRITADDPRVKELVDNHADLIRDRCAKGATNQTIGAELGVDRYTVGRAVQVLDARRQQQFDQDRIDKVLAGERVDDLNLRERLAVILEARDNLGLEWKHIDAMLGSRPGVSKLRYFKHRQRIADAAARAQREEAAA